MRRFLLACKHVRARYPVLWEQHGFRNRRIMVKYWIDDLYYANVDPRPGDQLGLWNV